MESEIIKSGNDSISIENLLTSAIQNNIPVESMERLLAMRDKIKAEKAKELFNHSMSVFQGECPTIVRTKEVKNRSGVMMYKYAPLESIVSQVKYYLQKNGFSYSTQVDITDKGVKATCKAIHKDGHEEISSMEVPLGTKTEIMSHSQVTAAASTFAKRYAFCNVFGILTGDEDTDASKQTLEEYDNEPIKEDAIPVVTFDEESKPAEPIEEEVAGWNAPKSYKLMNVTEKKNHIAKLCNDRVLVPLVSKKEYDDYIYEQTGLEMETKNLNDIIVKLESKNEKGTN